MATKQDTPKPPMPIRVAIFSAVDKDHHKAVADVDRQISRWLSESTTEILSPMSLQLTHQMTELPKSHTALHYITCAVMYSTQDFTKMLELIKQGKSAFEMIKVAQGLKDGSTVVITPQDMNGSDKPN